MATFSDLSRVLEDTIRVDMKKRWTPQEVKFINNKNEYFGTFHGKIVSVGAVLTDVELSNATFYDEDGNIVDVNNLLKMDGRLTNVEFGLDNLSTIVIHDIPKEIEEAVKNASGDLSKQLSDETEQRISVDTILSNYIEEKYNEEIKKREEVDSELSNLILSVENNSSDRYTRTSDRITNEVETLNKRIDEETEEIDDKIKETKESIETKIANDKHYEIKDVSNSDKNYLIKDFTLNIIKDSISEGEVFYNTKIGKIENVVYGSDGQINSIDFVTLNDFQDKDIEHCFNPYSTRFTFNENNNFTQESFGGYFIKFNRATKLSESTFSLNRNARGGCDINLGSTLVGTVLNDSYDETGKLVSGKIELVPGKASELSAFNGIQFTFDDTNQDYYFDGPTTGLSSRVHVIPALKKIHLKQNYRIANVINLRNQLSDDLEIGTIDEGQVDSSSVIVKITGNIDEQLTGVYTLNTQNDFKVDINKDYSIDYIAQQFRIYKNHFFYRYNLSTDISGDITETKATVSPDLENRLIGEGTFDTIKFSFEDSEFAYFSTQDVILTREEGFSKTISNENASITITFDEITNKVVAKETFIIKGGEFNKEYFLDPSIHSLITPTYRTDVAITQTVDISNPVFEHTEFNPDFEWDLDIGSHKEQEYPSYTLTINTENAGTVTLEFPENTYEKEVSQEFIVRMTINDRNSDGKFIPVKIANGVRLENGSKNDLFIKTNDTSMFLFRQLRNEAGHPVYLTEDLRYHDLEYFINELHGEIQTRKDEVSRLDGRIDDAEESIKEINDKLSGIINYHGIITINEDLSSDDRDNGFTKLFRNNGFQLTDDLSNGWFYLIDSTVEPVERHYVDDVKIGKGDYLKVNANIKVSELNKDNILILDNLDKDVVHTDLLNEISTILSNSVVTERERITDLKDWTDKNFFYLTGDNQISGNQTITGSLSVDEVYSSNVDITEATIDNLTITGKLTANDPDTKVIIKELDVENTKINNADINEVDIEDLSTSLSNVYFRDVKQTAAEIYEDLQGQITSNDVDIDNLDLSVGNLSGLLEKTLVSCDSISDVIDDLISGDIQNNRENIEELSNDYHKFFDNTFQASDIEHIKSYNMIITDETHKSEPDVHDQYYMTFKDGTLVLIKKTI